MVIALVALIVIGPERLPKVARTAGILLGRLQRYVSDVKADINREMQLDELKQLQEQVASQTRELETSLSQEMRSVEDSLNQTVAAPEDISVVGATASLADQTAAPLSPPAAALAESVPTPAPAQALESGASPTAEKANV